MTNQQGAPEALRFTKKPVTIEAIQWTGKNLREVITFTHGPPDTRSTHAGMAWEAYADLVARDGLKIYTLEGKMLANVGDWIIRGVKGEMYPCKDEIFRMTYEPAALVEAQQPAAHVQNPAEIEHVAGDVSKTGAEANTSAQQPAPATQQAGEVVAYLDIGAGGYLDLGSELSEDALQQLPKGRHALVIAGTYGIDGYVAAPQPSPTAQADSQPVMTPETVYAAIAHGDQDHRAWLLSALRAVWCGEAVPPVASPIADAAAESQPEPVLDYPPLPTTYYLAGGAVRTWDEGQMRAYVDADRAARAPADSVTAPAATPTAASIAWTALLPIALPSPLA